MTANAQPLVEDLEAHFVIQRGSFLVSSLAISRRPNAVNIAIAVNLPDGATPATTPMPGGVMVRWRLARDRKSVV